MAASAVISMSKIQAQRLLGCASTVVILTLMSALLVPAAGDGRPMISAGGKPTPLFWAYGVNDPRDLGDYADLGFNTLYVELPADPNFDFTATDELIDAAERREFYVIIGIQTAMRGIGRLLMVRPTDDEYREAVTQAINRIVRHYRNRRWLVAWATQDDPASAFQESDQEFRSYLKRWYFSDREFKRTWGIKDKRIEDVWITDAISMDDDQPFAAGPPTIDVAEYRRVAVMDLMDLWAQVIHEADPKHPILTGKLMDYKSLVIAPSSYAGIICFAHPDLLPPDDDTHYVQMVDIARRGNRFAAFPVFEVPTGLGARPGERLKRWFAEAILHGAAGLAVTPWLAIRRDPRAAAGVQQALSEACRPELFAPEPLASAAILLEPYADGALLPDGRGLCGFLPAISATEPACENEPSELIYTYRHGSRFGLMDYLSQDDASREALSRYGVIFAPMALSVPYRLERSLIQYVRNGGVLVADMGFGVRQSSRWGLMSRRLMAFFGIKDVASIEKDRLGNAFFWNKLALFPSIPPHTETSGNAFDYAFNGWMYRAVPGPGSVLYGNVSLYEVTSDAEGPRLQSSSPSAKAGGEQALAGIFVRQYGDGAAILATMRLWSNWLPVHRLYQEFHGDLLGRGAQMELVDEPALFPMQVNVVGTRRGCMLHNRTNVDWMGHVVDYAASGRLTRGAACRLSAAWRTANGQRSDEAELTVLLKRNQVRSLERVPIQVEPYEGEVTGLVRRYGPGKVVFELHGPGAVPARKEGQIVLRYGDPVSVRITLTDGQYPVAPGSLHRLTSTFVSGRDKREEILQADARGRLRFEGTYRNHIITIEPVAGIQ